MHKRPSSSYLTAVASILLAGLALVQAFWTGNQVPQTSGIVLFTLGLIWTYYVFPKVELGEQSVLIANPLTISRVGFGAIEEVDTRFALKLIGEEKSISAWAAPAPGRLRHRSHSPEDFKVLGLKSGESVRPGDMPSSISGSFALQIRKAIAEGKTADKTWSTKPNLLGLASTLLPLGFLILVHL